MQVGAQLRTLVDMPNSGLVALLKDDKFDDLRRMYNLFRRGGVPGGLAAMRAVMVWSLPQVDNAMPPNRGLDGTQVKAALKRVETRA